jgi:hypothetical protein
MRRLHRQERSGIRSSARPERNLKKDLNCSGGATDDDRLEGHAEFQN